MLRVISTLFCFLFIGFQLSAQTFVDISAIDPQWPTVCDGAIHLSISPELDVFDIVVLNTDTGEETVYPGINSITFSITDLCSGNYLISIDTDEVCELSVAGFVPYLSEINPCEFEFEPLVQHYYCEDNPGTIEFHIISSIGPIKVDWLHLQGLSTSINQGANPLSGLSPGTYCANLTDLITKCTATICVEVKDSPYDVSINTIEVVNIPFCIETYDPATCGGGSIEVEIAGMPGSYTIEWQSLNYDTYQWETIGNSEIVTDLCPGPKEIKVYDEYGCLLAIKRYEICCCNSNFTVPEIEEDLSTFACDLDNYAPTIDNISLVNSLDEQSQDGSYQFIIEGTYSFFSVTGPNNFHSENSAEQNLAPGEYCYSLSSGGCAPDIQGCFTIYTCEELSLLSIDVLIDELEIIQPCPELNYINIDAQHNGSITVNTNYAWTSFDWDNGQNDVTFIENLTNGIYIAEIIWDNCNLSDVIKVELNADWAAIDTIESDEFCQFDLICQGEIIDTWEAPFSAQSFDFDIDEDENLCYDYWCEGYTLLCKHDGSTKYIPIKEEHQTQGATILFTSGNSLSNPCTDDCSAEVQCTAKTRYFHYIGWSEIDAINRFFNVECREAGVKCGDTTYDCVKIGRCLYKGNLGDLGDKCIFYNGSLWVDDYDYPDQVVAGYCSELSQSIDEGCDNWTCEEGCHDFPTNTTGGGTGTDGDGDGDGDSDGDGDGDGDSGGTDGGEDCDEDKDSDNDGVNDCDDYCAPNNALIYPGALCTNSELQLLGTIDENCNCFVSEDCLCCANGGCCDLDPCDWCVFSCHASIVPSISNQINYPRLYHFSESIDNTIQIQSSIKFREGSYTKFINKYTGQPAVGILEDSIANKLIVENNKKTLVSYTKTDQGQISRGKTDGIHINKYITSRLFNDNKQQAAILLYGEAGIRLSENALLEQEILLIGHSLSDQLSLLIAENEDFETVYLDKSFNLQPHSSFWLSLSDEGELLDTKFTNPHTEVPQIEVLEDGTKIALFKYQNELVFDEQKLIAPDRVRDLTPKYALAIFNQDFELQLIHKLESDQPIIDAFFKVNGKDIYCVINFQNNIKINSELIYQSDNSISNAVLAQFNLSGDKMTQYALLNHSMTSYLEMNDLLVKDSQLYLTGAFKGTTHWGEEFELRSNGGFDIININLNKEFELQGWLSEGGEKDEISTLIIDDYRDNTIYNAGIYKGNTTLGGNDLKGYDMTFSTFLSKFNVEKPEKRKKVSPAKPSPTVPLQLYPNPANNRLYVQSDGTDLRSMSFIISNAQGSQLELPHAANSTSTMEINIRDLPEGIYFLQVKKEDQLIDYKKFIIIR